MAKITNSGADTSKRHRAFCEETIKLTGRLDFDTSMNISQGGICKINAEIKNPRKI